MFAPATFRRHVRRRPGALLRFQRRLQPQWVKLFGGNYGSVAMGLSVPVRPGRTVERLSGAGDGGARRSKAEPEVRRWSGERTEEKYAMVCEEALLGPVTS